MTARRRGSATRKGGLPRATLHVAAFRRFVLEVVLEVCDVLAIYAPKELCRAEAFADAAAAAAGRLVAATAWESP